VVGIDGHAAGLVVYADPLRPAVPALLERLRTLGVRETAELSGHDQRIGAGRQTEKWRMTWLTWV
jgi:cation transport ATPase